MTTATLTKVGNSMAVVLPKGLRQQAGFEAGEKLSIDSPRKGVVVIMAIHDDAEDRLARLEKVEARISKRSRLAPSCSIWWIWRGRLSSRPLIPTSLTMRMGSFAPPLRRCR